MEREIKAKMDELIALLKDPEVTVSEKEMIVKLEKVLELMNNPEQIAAERAKLQERLKAVVTLVDKASVDPDIDVEYCVSENGEAPYIAVKYAEDKYVERKIRLTDKYLDNSAEEIAKLVTFSIEQFKEEIDSVQMG